MIDRTTTRLEDVLAARGDQVGTFVNYDMREQQVAANAKITMSITVLGLLIVAISMVALINAITMGILERTREIGVLRSHRRPRPATCGASSPPRGSWSPCSAGRSASRSATRWRARSAGSPATPSGSTSRSCSRSSTWRSRSSAQCLLALVVMLAPLRRAVRFKPGEALRYA